MSEEGKRVGRNEYKKRRGQTGERGKRGGEEKGRDIGILGRKAKIKEIKNSFHLFTLLL